jgi:pyruvate kinase
MWENLKIKAFIIFTKSWLLARLASSFKPNFPIYAFTNKTSSLLYMNILLWINPILLKWYNKENYDETLDKAIKHLKGNKIISNDDSIITIYDTQRNWKDISTMKIINIEDW